MVVENLYAGKKTGRFRPRTGNPWIGVFSRATTITLKPCSAEDRLREGFRDQENDYAGLRRRVLWLPVWA